jgi:hypothetical protein
MSLETLTTDSVQAGLENTWTLSAYLFLKTQDSLIKTHNSIMIDKDQFVNKTNIPIRTQISLSKMSQKTYNINDSRSEDPLSKYQDSIERKSNGGKIL